MNTVEATIPLKGAVDAVFREVVAFGRDLVRVVKKDKTTHTVYFHTPRRYLRLQNPATVRVEVQAAPPGRTRVNLTIDDDRYRNGGRSIDQIAAALSVNEPCRKKRSPEAGRPVPTLGWCIGSVIGVALGLAISRLLLRDLFQQLGKR